MKYRQTSKKGGVGEFLEKCNDTVNYDFSFFPLAVKCQQEVIVFMTDRFNK